MRARCTTDRSLLAARCACYRFTKVMCASGPDQFEQLGIEYARDDAGGALTTSFGSLKIGADLSLKVHADHTHDLLAC